MADVLSGTLTFLATDIEGSTVLWERDRAGMTAALARHDEILRASIAAQGGHVFKTTGDGMLAAFASARPAVVAALQAQRQVTCEEWRTPEPLRVRMALHSGEAEIRDGDYFGPPVNRVARILAAGHGGQVLLSQAAERLVADRVPDGVALRDLGIRSLKDLSRPERLFQVVTDDLPADFPPLRTLDARPHNLPAELTPLVGREDAVAALRSLLLRPDVRLVTLTGVGGTGKTRLALQVAAEVIDGFQDGVFLVNLAPVTDPALVASTVLHALDASADGDGSPEAALAEHLRRRELLLILDNFEQLVAAAPVVADLLRAASSVKALVTSQAALRLRGEHELPLEPLGVPPQTAFSATDVGAHEAVQLFVQRAQAVAPGFELTDRNAAAVAGIARQLDGLPLALELAAARIKLFSPEALLRRLDRAVDFLTSGERDRPDRHRTLRNAIAWTYDLLSDDDRRVLERTSVFEGGFSLESAEAVALEPGEELDVLGSLSSLVEKSLLRQVSTADGEPRFERLRTIRAYARERLAAAGETDRWRRRHAQHFADLTNRMESGAAAEDPGRAMEWVTVERENLRAALEWALDAGEASLALRLCQALPVMWFRFGLFTEARRWLDRVAALAASLSDLERAHLLNLSGRLAQIRGDNSRGVVEQFEESLRLYRAAGHRAGTARALMNLGNVRSRQGAYAEARSLFEESLELYRGLDDALGISGALMNLGDAHAAEGDLARAKEYFQQSADLSRRRGNRIGLGFALQYLGSTKLQLGSLAEAEALFRESGEIFESGAVGPGIAWTAYYLGDLALARGDLETARSRYVDAMRQFAELEYPPGIAESFFAFAALAVEEGRWERAARLLGAAQAARGEGGFTRAALELAREETTHARCRDALGEEAFERAFSQGSAMPEEEAARLALEGAAVPA